MTAATFSVSFLCFMFLLDRMYIINGDSIIKYLFNFLGSLQFSFGISFFLDQSYEVDRNLFSSVQEDLQIDGKLKIRKMSLRLLSTIKIDVLLIVFAIISSIPVLVAGYGILDPLQSLTIMFVLLTITLTVFIATSKKEIVNPNGNRK